MITGIDVNQIINFVSAHDKSDPKTIWKIGILDYLSYMKISEGMVPGKEVESCIQAAKYGLRGVENYSVPFDKEKIDDFIKTIPPIILIEIGSKILRLSTMSEDEIKNS
jgi:hypothetical protein